MCKNYCSLLFLAAIAVVGMAACVQAETVLFSDNFDGANNGAPDKGLNSDPLATRHSAGGGAYLWAVHTGVPAAQVQVNNPARGGAGTLAIDGSNTVPYSSNYGSAIIQHDFASVDDVYAMTHGFESNSISPYAGFTIRYDIDPMCLGTIGSNHSVGGGCGLGIGAATGYLDNTKPAGGTGRGYYYEPTTDFVSTMSESGVFNAFRNTSPPAPYTNTLLTSPASPVFDATPPTGSNHVEWYTCEIRVATSSFASGAPATISFWVGAQGTPSGSLTQIKIAGNSMPGMADGKSKTIAWDANGINYIDFSMQGYPANDYTQAPSAFDNIVITANGVPEPGTLALLAAGLIGLLCYAWRKRK